MSDSSYLPPVDRLLTYGDARNLIVSPSYADLGFAPEHIPDLIRLATDRQLLQSDSDSLEVWAPVHAWRVLGQLRAEAASAPLLSLFDVLDADEWIIEEMPKIYGQIGAVAIPALAGYLAEPGHLLYSYVSASLCLKEIGQQQPAVRADCVNLIAQRLADFATNDPTLNASLISDLLDLKAVEAAPLMERAFEARQVDLSLIGDWEDAQVELGLLARRLAPRRNYVLENLFGQSGETPESSVTGERPVTVKTPGARPPTNKKAKAKRKQAEKSRKKNRKRK